MTIAALLIATAIGQTTPQPALQPAAPEKRPTLARFSLQNLDGKRVRSKDLEGKVTIVSFWATWCAPCKQELTSGDGLQVLAIATDGPESRADVRSVTKRKRWRFDVLPDPDGKATAALNPRGSVPYTLFVDRRGRVAHIHAGYTPGDEGGYQSVIDALLAESL